MRVRRRGYRFQYIKCAGSARRKNHGTSIRKTFQYIKCAGSAIYRQTRTVAGGRDFNTSNVPVPQKENEQIRREKIRFQYIKCAGSAIIKILDPIDYPRFQYIKCAGSAIQR